MAAGVSKIRAWFYKEKFTFLLFSLVLYEIASPFFDFFFKEGLFVDLAFLMVLLSAVFASISGIKRFVALIVISSLYFIIFGYKIFISEQSVFLLDIVIKMLFNGFMIYIIASDFYKSDSVSRDTISSALIVYLFIALFWSNLYLLLEIYYPNSFNMPHETLLAAPQIFRYFSFVTLTTLGYGDIVPLSIQAKNMAVFQAFVGQMYVAVFIARLVAIHTSQATLKRKD